MEGSVSEARPRELECRRCRHYFVTHDPRAPHGCRLFAIKSRNLPAVEVGRASGRECQAYEPRTVRRPGR